MASRKPKHVAAVLFLIFYVIKLCYAINLQTSITITEDLNAPKLSAFITGFGQNKTEQFYI